MKAMSLSEKLRLRLETSTNFGETVEVNGTTFAKNRDTGEVMKPDDA
jgi:hypothetical protein